MIEFSRSLARQLWAIFKRCAPRSHSSQPPSVEFRTDPNGLFVRLAQPEVAVEYRQPGSFATESLSLPLSAVADFEGRGQDLVTLQSGKDGQLLAHWQDGGIPQTVEYSTADGAQALGFPEPPTEFIRNSPGLLAALEEAGKTAATDGVRFAIHRLQFRGRSGEIVATDGKQLLLQGGFQFPWDDNVLVPRVAAFGCKELQADGRVEVGKLESWVVLRTGCWTFYLHIDADARFPQVEAVIPKLRERTATWHIAPEDVAFLARALPRLPCPDDDSKPVTVDLNGQVCLRARSTQNRITEVQLARSAFTGQPVRICIDRQLLSRVLQLGFDEVSIFGADKPILAQDNQRTLVIMPLPKEGALGPTEDMIQIRSAEEKNGQPRPKPERTNPAMITSRNGNGHGLPQQSDAAIGPGHSGVIAEAQALKDALHEAFGRAGRLVAALRRSRRQTKLVQSTLASLKQLQRIDG